jgi:uncharacterized protein (TIGR02996 family)
MSPEQAFLQEIAAQPTDDTPRLVYADWLDEQDDPRGSYLRAEVELARLPESHERYEETELALRALAESIEPAWIAAAGKRYDVVLHSYNPMLKIQIIKIIRELTGEGLKDSKDLAEALPSAILAGVTRQEAEHAREQLRYLQGYEVAEVELRVSAFGARQPLWAYPKLSASPSVMRSDQRGPVAPPAPGGRYELALQGYPAQKKILVIKLIRELTGLGLKEAKDLSETPLPVVLRSDMVWEDALLWQGRFGQVAEVVVRTAGGAIVPAAPASVPDKAASAGGAFDLLLVSYPMPRKIEVIKAIRELTGLGLKEAKDLSEAPRPLRLLAGVSQERAEQARQCFGSCAVVEVRPAGRR